MRLMRGLCQMVRTIRAAVCGPAPIVLGIALSFDISYQAS
jgi:hypothetical protein